MSGVPIGKPVTIVVVALPYVERQRVDDRVVRAGAAWRVGPYEDQDDRLGRVIHRKVEVEALTGRGERPSPVLVPDGLVRVIEQ